MAIAFDSKLDATATTGTSHTTAFTNTAGNIIVVGLFVGDTSTSFSNVQYAGVAMTATPEGTISTGGGVGGNERIAMFWLVSPATGANNITYTSSANTSCQVAAVSYSGASTTGQPDAHTSTLSAGTTDLTLTMTTASDNAWLVGFWRNAYEAASAGSNTTFRTTANNTIPMGDRGPCSPAGSFSVIAHDGNSRDWSGLGMAIKPAGAATASLPLRNLLGVGL